MGNILILSGPIQSGKTTSIFKFIANKKKVGGFLCPDINGKRMIYFPNENSVGPFQVEPSEDTLNIGKFSFDHDVFNKACELLVSPLTLANELVVVDEVGPMELKEQGYYSSLNKLIVNWNSNSSGVLILVVREHLVREVKDKFDLKEVDVISIKDLTIDTLPSNNINAAILCGGESSRMKIDKFNLKYDGVEQYKRLFQIFNELYLSSILSCNDSQFLNFNRSFDLIVDNKIYSDGGPLTGILSVYDQVQSDLIIVGCDYPLLQKQHIEILKQFSMYGFTSIGFVKKNRPGYVEPLICYLSITILNQLKNYFLEGGRSLNHYLQQVNPLKIQLLDDRFLKSFDTPEDYQSYSNY
ncbi:MAG: NTP transferase domain-containing protein [Bacteroidota bacterium]